MIKNIRWTITKKVGGTVFLLLAFILVLLIHSVYSLNEIGVELREVAEIDVPLAEHANEIEIAQLEQRILMDEYIRQQLDEKNENVGSSVEYDKKAFHDWNEKVNQEFSLAITTVEKGMHRSSAEQLKSILKTLVNLQASHNEIVELVEKLLESGYQHEKVAEIVLLDEKFDQLAIELIHGIEKLTQRKSALALKHEQQFELINYSLSGVACLVGLFLTYMIIVSIKVSIGKMTRNIELVTTAIQSKEAIKVDAVERVSSNDELSDLASNLSNMIEKVSSDIDEREKASQVLTEKVTKDHLTGCFNRSKWDEERECQLVASLQQNAPLSLIFFDIDHFKRINDNFGHDIGDQTLIDVVQVVEKALRKHDTLFRTGGEEFSILLPDTALEEAGLLAERIRSAIEAHIFKVVEKVTISLGVTQFMGAEDTSSAFSKRADEALYASKNNGRNRVSFLPT